MAILGEKLAKKEVETIRTRKARRIEIGLCGQYFPRNFHSLF